MRWFHRYFLVFFMAGTFNACAQRNKIIANAHAFYVVTIPGNIAVDENGRPRNAGQDTSTFVYVETTGSDPIWQYAWINDSVYQIDFSKVKENPAQVGFDKRTRTKITIPVASANTLWMLRLVPTDAKYPAPEKIMQGELLLQGVSKKTRITKKVNFQTELHSGFSQ